MSYQIVGNTDPRVGVSIDGNQFIDINPQPGVELESTVTVEARDGAGNTARADFVVRVQKPIPALVIGPGTLKVVAGESRSFTVEIQDQFRRRYTAEEVELTTDFDTAAGTLTPATVKTKTGRATFTYNAGDLPDEDTVTIIAAIGVAAEIRVQVIDHTVYIPSLRTAP